MADDTLPHPRDHNAPPDQTTDYAAEMQTALEGRYFNLADEVAKALDEARELPAKVDDDDTLGAVGRVIKRLRDLDGRIESFRVGEKEPHLRRGNAVDSFFHALRDKLTRRVKGNQAGAIDVLQARADDFMQRKRAAEEARRRAEAERLAREAREAQEKAARERREAEEARLAAERARKPENKEAKGAVAAEAEAAATTAQIDAAVVAGKAEAAYVDTLAKPADMARTRLEGGVTATMATEPYAEIVDSNLLDKEKLWPFIAEDAKAKALRAWAKTTGHAQQMPGAAVGKRAKSVIR